MSGIDLDYLAIFRRFNELKIDYLVVGGLAVNLHGVPRMTYDIDLAIRLESENVGKFVFQLNEWGYRPKVPLRPVDLVDKTKRELWIEEKGMKAFNFYNQDQPIAEIDVVLEIPFSYAELKNRAVSIDLQGNAVPVIAVADLIAMKRHSGRRQDIADIEHLMNISKQ